MTNKIRILYVEDHEMVRESMKLMLAHQTTFEAIVDVGANGTDAICKALSKNYDIIILDINIPEKDGIEVTRHLFAKGKKPNILALSMHEEDFIIKSVIKAGALGYINKNSSFEELAEAILAVAKGKTYLPKELDSILLKKKGNSIIRPIQKHDPINLLKTIGLTKREIQVLQLLIKKLNNKQIADELIISERTVGNHRFRIMQKLDLHSLAEIIAFAHENELV